MEICLLLGLKMRDGVFLATDLVQIVVAFEYASLWEGLTLVLLLLLLGTLMILELTLRGLEE